MPETARHLDRLVWKEREPGGMTVPIQVPVVETVVDPGKHSTWQAEVDGKMVDIQPTETYSDFLLRATG